MPKPIYIVCSESGAEDRISGQVSLFNLFEKIQIQKLPDQKQGLLIVGSLPLWVTAMWMREDGDEGAEFEFEVNLRLPMVSDPVSVGKGIFQFEKEFYRYTSRIRGQLPFGGPGAMFAESRLRRSGEEQWIAQECPILVEEIPLPPTGESHSGHIGN